MFAGTMLLSNVPL